MVGTTNIELIDIAKDLSIPNFYCICKDEMNQCPTENIIINIIVNLNDSVGAFVTWRTHMRRVFADCLVSGVVHERALLNCERESLQ